MAEEISDEPELAHARCRSKREMRDHDDQRVTPFAETRPERTTTRDAARQRIVEHFVGLHACEKAVARRCEPRHAPVRLMAPERKRGRFGKVLRLVQKAGAQAAGVGFLKADEIELADHAREHVEVRALPGREHVLPAVRDVVAIAADAAAGEDVAAQEIEALRFAGRTLGGGRHGMLHAREASGGIDASQALAVGNASGRCYFFFFAPGFDFASISFWTSQSTSSISCG